MGYLSFLFTPPTHPPRKRNLVGCYHESKTYRRVSAILFYLHIWAILSVISLELGLKVLSPSVVR